MKWIEKNYRYDDLDIKIAIDTLLINIIHIAFMPASSMSHITNHCHSCYELHYIPYGKGTLIANDKRYMITPGTFYLTGPGVYHEQISDLEDPMAECGLSFSFSIYNKKKKSFTVPREELEEIIHVLSITKFWFGIDTLDTISLFKKIAYELENLKFGYFSSLQNYLSQIIINSLRCYVDQKRADYNFPKKIIDNNRDTIIYDFFNDPSSTLTPELLAKDLGLSVRQLDRILNDKFSLGFKEILLERRLELSKTLLRDTNLSIEDISWKSGFSSSPYFCNVFKKNEGFTPLKYRKGFN